jgi:undecaprenyl-diphosphatase
MSNRRTLLLAVLLLVCFLLLAIFKNAFNGVDLEVNLWTASFDANFFQSSAIFISNIFANTYLLIVSVVVALGLFLFRQKRFGVLLLGAMVGEVLLVDLCKQIIFSPRPTDSVVLVVGNSFPSTHVTDTLVLFGVLTFIVWSKTGNSKYRLLSGVVSGFVVGVVGFDRLYLNVHWLTDVVGAFLLGGFWLLLCFYLCRQYSPISRC